MQNRIIIYDSECAFCTECIRFFLSKSKDNITALPVKSKEARTLLRAFNKRFIDLQTIYFIDNGILTKRSLAIFLIHKHLKFPYNLISILSILPVKLTDYCYNLISKNRYKIVKQRAGAKALEISHYIK